MYELAHVTYGRIDPQYNDGWKARMVIQKAHDRWRLVSARRIREDATTNFWLKSRKNNVQCGIESLFMALSGV